MKQAINNTSPIVPQRNKGKSKGSKESMLGKRNRTLLEKDGDDATTLQELLSKLDLAYQ